MSLSQVQSCAGYCSIREPLNYRHPIGQCQVSVIIDYYRHLALSCGVCNSEVLGHCNTFCHRCVVDTNITCTCNVCTCRCSRTMCFLFCAKSAQLSSPDPTSGLWGLNVNKTGKNRLIAHVGKGGQQPVSGYCTNVMQMHGTCTQNMFPFIPKLCGVSGTK